MKLLPFLVSLQFYWAPNSNSVIYVPLSVHIHNRLIQLLSQAVTESQPRPTRGENDPNGGGIINWRQFFPNSRPPEEHGSIGGDTKSGDDVCVIAPNNNNEAVMKVWRDTPTLTWSGQLTQVEIREMNNRKPLWRKRVSAANQVNLNLPNAVSLNQVTVGTQLQPGQTYQWYFSDKPKGEYDEYRPVKFQVMTAQEQEVVSLELQQLEQKLKEQNITGNDAILERADYFASQKLWSEFWQEVGLLESPPEDLKQLLGSTVDGLLCQ